MNQAVTVTSRRDPALAALATIYLLGGSFCLLGALAPPSSQTPRLLHAMLAGIGLLGGALQWWASGPVGRRVARPALHVGLVVNTALTWLLMVNAATSAGHVLVGYNFVYLVMVAAYFLPRREARTHTVLVIVAVLTACQASHLDPRAMVGPVVAVSVITVSEVLGRLATRLRCGATTDPLTGVLNRAAFMDAGHALLESAARRRQPVSLVVADLDDFKRINDEQGHTAGDLVLTTVADEWRSCLRSGDLLARIGGDEFVLLLPGATRDQAEDVVERMRSAADVRWSSGIATGQPGSDMRTLFEVADRELYVQKRQREGRPGDMPSQRATTSAESGESPDLVQPLG